MSVRIKPGAKREGPVEVSAGALVMGVRARPVEGKANDALVRSISKLLGRPRRDVELLRGRRSRHKQLLVHGIEADEVARVVRAALE